jgi:hypothetical protein
MVRTLATFFGFVSIAFCANSLGSQERKEGFELLFDGKTLTHWHSIKLRPDAGSWSGRKGTLTWAKGGSWLATDDTYYDFILRLEYRTGPQSKSGIILRAKSTGVGSPGLTLGLSGGEAPALTLGLSDVVAPSKNMSKPDGEWNQVEVTVIKREVTAVWNGEKILAVNLDERTLAGLPPFGHIGLQADSTGAPVEFRNIRIKVVKAGPNFSQDR